MTWWNVYGQLVDDSQPGVSLPENAVPVAEYGNVAQYGQDRFAWDPASRFMGGQIQQTAPGYVAGLLDLRDRVRQGQAQPWEAEQLQQWEAQARAIPTRDMGSLTAGWQGEREGNQDWWTRLDPGSPDVGPIMLALRDKMEQGSATPQERQLFQQVYGMAADWDYRATVPQASDAFSPLGDNLFSALGMLAIGASGGLAAAPLAAGGATAATTLGSLGTLAGIAGTGAGVLGSAMEQPWLSHIGLGLGALGGIAGGVGGLTNLWGTGVQSLSDAARLASSAGRITGALGSASGVDALRQAGSYLGQAGQLGSFGAGVLPTSFTDWRGDNAPWAANIAPQVAPRGVQNLLSAADMATQRGGGAMSEYDWLNLDLSSGGDMGGAGVWAGGSPTWNDGGGASWWDMGGAGVLAPQPGSQSWAEANTWTPYGGWNAGGAGSGVFSPEWQQSGQDVSWAQSHPGSGVAGASGGNWLSTLGSLGSGALRLLMGGAGGGAGAGLLGPLLSGAGGLGAGAIGSNASAEAARLQAAALNRGIDLQTAQWLQSQANQAPWLQAGQQALPQLQQLAGQGQPTFQQPGLPGTQPFQYSGPGMPGQGFQYTGAGMPATGFQYTGPGMPDAGFQYTNQMPTQAFQAPTFEALKARDPGIQARLDEARNALEASALARGTGMSGATLAALQRQSQNQAAQEYQPAYLRALGEYQQEYGQDWQRQQEAYLRALAQNQQLYGRQYQQQGDLYGRQLSENQLGYNRQWQQQETDYQRQLAQNQLLYGRGMEQYRQGYGEHAALNQQDYARQQALYQQQYQQMQDAYNAQRLGQTTDWNRYAALAGLGQTAVGQLGTAGQNTANQQAALLGQLGSAQAGGSLGGAQSWMSALGNVGNAVQGGLANNALLSALQGINR